GTTGGMRVAKTTQDAPMLEDVPGSPASFEVRPVHHRPEIGVPLGPGNPERTRQLVAVVDLRATWRQEESSPGAVGVLSFNIIRPSVIVGTHVVQDRHAVERTTMQR